MKLLEYVPPLVPLQAGEPKQNSDRQYVSGWAAAAKGHAAAPPSSVMKSRRFIR